MYEIKQTLRNNLLITEIWRVFFADHATFQWPRKMPAHTWWSSYGSETPQLQSLAIKVLSQVTVALACERNWSTFEFIHSTKRNRLTSERAANLVFVFSSLRLREKLFDPEYKVKIIECIDEDE